MISAGEFRNGVTFEQDGQVLQVVEFQHVKPGKGAAFVRTKTKNVITGAVIETSYNPTAKFPQAFIERREVTYSYQDGDLYHFMDNETYDDIPVNASDVPDNFKFCKVLQVVEFQHVKPGKGAAFVRTKMKNVITGAVVETSFNPTAKFEEATIERKSMEYSYADGNLYYFMDPESYELVPIDESLLGDSFKFVTENMTCVVMSYKGKVFAVEPPNFVELTVTQTDPGFAGNTATNATKPATVETGATVKVPLFINEGDKIKIDTRSGEYLERAKG